MSAGSACRPRDVPQVTNSCTHPHTRRCPPLPPPADKALACAAEQLHQLRFLLLHAALPAETAPVRQQLLVRAAAGVAGWVGCLALAARCLVGWLVSEMGGWLAAWLNVWGWVVPTASERFFLPLLHACRSAWQKRC